MRALLFLETAPLKSLRRLVEQSLDTFRSFPEVSYVSPRRVWKACGGRALRLGTAACVLPAGGQRHPGKVSRVRRKFDEQLHVSQTIWSFARFSLESRMSLMRGRCSQIHAAFPHRGRVGLHCRLRSKTVSNKVSEELSQQRCIEPH